MFSNKTIYKVLVVAAVFTALACDRSDVEKPSKDDFAVTTNVILDTDIGNSLDDVVAMDILFHEQKASNIRLLGVMVNHDHLLAPQVVDIMNTWYGYPSTPIGMVRDGVTDCRIWEDYAPLLCSNELFLRSVDDYAGLPDAVDLYRELLSQSEDGSVTILSIGFFTNLARLLESAPDEYSPLSGRELVRRKVKTVVAMCGSTSEPEYNVYNDLESAKAVFSQLPVTMTVIPAEVHLDVSTVDIGEATSWVVPHPIHDSFTTLHSDDRNWLWDASAALCLVKGFSNAVVSERCEASIEAAGTMRLTPNATGRFRTVSLTESQTAHNESLLLEYLGTAM